VMVASAWKVERYRTFGDGFWNLYFTWTQRWWSERSQSEKIEKRGPYERGAASLPSPVSNGNPTIRLETPAAVPARKSSVGSGLSGERGSDN
jgi:hypothetical protein